MGVTDNEVARKLLELTSRETEKRLRRGSSKTAKGERLQGGGGSGPTDGFRNPMSAAWDLIVGGQNGAARRLPVGPTGTVLGVTGGGVGWVPTPTGPTGAPGVLGGTGPTGMAGATGPTAAITIYNETAPVATSDEIVFEDGDGVVLTTVGTVLEVALPRGPQGFTGPTGVQDGLEHGLLLGGM